MLNMVYTHYPHLYEHLHAAINDVRQLKEEVVVFEFVDLKSGKTFGSYKRNAFFYG